MLFWVPKLLFVAIRAHILGLMQPSYKKRAENAPSRRFAPPLAAPTQRILTPKVAPLPLGAQNRLAECGHEGGRHSFSFAGALY